MATKVTRLVFGLGAAFTSGVYVHYYSTLNHFIPWDYNWDRRQNDYDSISKSLRKNGKRSVTLIRHSQYNRVQGENNDDKYLTDIGRQQAHHTAKRFNERGIRFDKIYCASFRRARETCEIIVCELEHNDVEQIEYDSDLNEGLAAMMEPYESYKTLSEYIREQEEQSPAIHKAFKKYIHRREKSEMVKDTTREREDVLIVGHGNVFRYFITKALQFDKNGWMRFGMANCGISRINIRDDGVVRVNHVGDTGHLPKDLLTNNEEASTL
eukprot:843788_1